MMRDFDLKRINSWSKSNKYDSKKKNSIVPFESKSRQKRHLGKDDARAHADRSWAEGAGIGCVYARRIEAVSHPESRRLGQF